MKTTIKLGLCAAAFLLMFAGCSNAVKPTTVAKDSFRGNADAHNNSPAEILEISSTSVVPTKYGDADNKYLIEVTFSKPVTDSVKNAITFNALTPSGAIDKAPTIGSAVPADITADGTVARCVVTGKDIVVWMKVTGSAVEAVNGRHLNLDSDTIEGEVDDDDYYKPFVLGTPTGILGATRYLNNGNANDTYGSWNLNPSFELASTDIDSSTHKPKDPSLGTLVNRAEITFNPENNGVTADSITGILKDHLRIEQYVNGEWKEVTTTFTYNNATTPADRKWTAPLTLNSDTKVRYKWIGLRSMPKLKHTDTKYQYDMKYAMKCDIADIVVPISANEKNTNRKAMEFDFWNATSVMDAKKATDGITGIDLKLNLAANTFDTSFIDKTLASVQVTPKKDTGNNYFVDFAGFDESVLKKENFKIVYTGGKYSYSYSKPGLSDKGGVKLTSAVDFRWNMKLTEDQIKGSELAITGVEVYGADSTAISTYPKAVRTKVSLRYTDMIYTKAQAKKILQDDLKNLESKCVTNFYNAVYNKVPVDEKKNKSLKEAQAWQFVNAALTEFIKEVDAATFNVTEDDYAASTVNFYISPEVKIAKFTGVYQDGTNKKDITVPALGFGARTPQDDQYANAGWVKVTITP